MLKKTKETWSDQKMMEIKVIGDWEHHIGLIKIYFFFFFFHIEEYHIKSVIIQL